MVIVGYPVLIIWSLISTSKRSRRGGQMVNPEWVRVEGEDVNPNPRSPAKSFRVHPIYRVTTFTVNSPFTLSFLPFTISLIPDWHKVACPRLRTNRSQVIVGLLSVDFPLFQEGFLIWETVIGWRESDVWYSRTRMYAYQTWSLCILTAPAFLPGF